MNRPARPSARQQIAIARGLERSPYETMRAVYNDHGPLVDLGWKPFRYTLAMGIEANEYVLHTNPSNFTWRDAFRLLVPIDGETALIVSDGADHKRRKAIVLPAFHRKRISSYCDVMVDETNRAVRSWRPGATVDVYRELRTTIRRIVLRCLFGDAFADDALVRDLEVGLAYVNRSPLRRIDSGIYPPYRRAMRARARLDALVFGEIGRRRSVAHSGDDIVGWLIEAQEDGSGLTDQEVRDQVISIIAASVDTTAATIGWIATRLAEDTALRMEVASEVADVTGGHRLTIDHMPQLRLANGVVNEVLRLNSPAVIAPRRVESPFQLYGCTVPSGLLAYSAYVTHTLPEQFPDPLVFKPTRWIDGHADHHPHHPYAYAPFGGGSRRCLGFAFALQELAVMTAALSHVEMTPAYTGTPRPVGIAALAPDGGVPVRIGATASIAT